MLTLTNLRGIPYRLDLQQTGYESRDLMLAARAAARSRLDVQSA